MSRRGSETKSLTETINWAADTLASELDYLDKNTCYQIIINQILNVKNPSLGFTAESNLNYILGYCSIKISQSLFEGRATILSLLYSKYGLRKF